MPIVWSRVQRNLGESYSDLASYVENPVESTNSSLEYFSDALSIIKKEDFPQDFAHTRNSLGVAYLRLSSYSDDNIANLKIAVKCFEDALEIIKESDAPQDWSMIQNNLGLVNQGLNEIQKSINCFRAALQVRDVKLRSTDCLQTAKNLGNLGFKEEMWDIAIEGYGFAIQAVENIRSWSKNDDRRAEIHVKAIEIYTNIIQAFVNLEQYDKAIEYAERSRSQRIVDLLHSNDLYPQGDIPEIVQQKLAEFQAKQSAIDILLQQLTNGRQRQTETAPRHRAITESFTVELQQLENEKQIIYQELRSHDPVLAGQVKVDPLPFAKMQELLKEQSQTAILYFYITTTTTLIFIVQSDQIALHQCPDQGTELNKFLFENWLNPYLTNRSAWSEQMSTILAALAQRLNFNQLLKDHIPDRIQELIIVPHLYLHQIPFAALPISPIGEILRAEYLSDRYHLRTISSLQILSYCQNREPIAASQYATVENATNDLPFAGFEGEQVAQIFQVPSDRRLIGRDAATKSNYRNLLKTNSSLLSSHHATSRIDKPLESLLQLGDGFIALDELLMSRYPYLSDVFLSCCETGLGAPQNLSDDILTLATGFLCAGARTVISSLWAVDDLATAVFSILYHQERKIETKPAIALQKAQKQLREMTGEDLAENFGEVIESFLKRLKLKLVKEQDQPPSDSKQWKELDKSLEKVSQMQKNLEKHYRSDRPFSTPDYWSAFNCQGIG